MVYVLLPAYNEALNIEAVVQEIRGVLGKANELFEIVVVNDGSTDQTKEKLAELALNKQDLKVINFDQNQGVDSVFKVGIKDIILRAKADDFLITMDCDQSHSAQVYGEILQALRDGNDIAIASRYHNKSKTIQLPLKRKILSDTINWFLRTVFPVSKAKDYTTFFRGSQIDILQKADKHYQNRFIEQKGFPCMSEILGGFA